MAPLRLPAASGWSRTSLWQPLAARNSLQWTVNTEFVPSVRSSWLWKLLLMLQVKDRGIMWFKSVVGMTSKGPWSRVSTHSSVYLLLSWRVFLLQTKEDEKERANLYEVALWMPIWVSSIWSLSKRERRIFLDVLVLLWLHLGPKS